MATGDLDRCGGRMSMTPQHWMSMTPTPDIDDANSANGALTSINISNNNLTHSGYDMSGIKAFVAAIPECK